MKATEVTAGLTESNGSLLPGLWRDSLHVTCGLTACTPGSAPGPTLGNEYGKTLPFLECINTPASGSFAFPDPQRWRCPLQSHWRHRPQQDLLDPPLVVLCRRGEAIRLLLVQLDGKRRLWPGVQRVFSASGLVPGRTSLHQNHHTRRRQRSEMIQKFDFTADLHDGYRKPIRTSHRVLLFRLW